MFIAQVDEVDAYDANGCRVNDINSLAEYIHDVILDHHGKSRPDEDDDNARYFHIDKTFDFSFSQQGIVSGTTALRTKGKNCYPGNSGKPVPADGDVVTPPPKPV